MQCKLGLVVPAPEERAWCCIACWELKSDCSSGTQGWCSVCLSETPLTDGYFPLALRLPYGDLGAGVANAGKKTWMK